MVEFSLIGVSLSFLKRFLSEIDSKTLETATTTDICEKIVKPLTADQKCSYVDYLKRKQPNVVGKASVFISHAWKYKFQSVISSLLEYFESRQEPDTTIIWFDLFSNNQHAAAELPFEWWCNTFKSAIQSFGRTLMVFSPWNDPIPLTRGWCIWELYCTMQTQCSFDVVMTEDSIKDFMTDIESDPRGSVDKMLATVDCEKSQCFKKEDQERIHDAIRRTVGFQSLNKMIFAYLRNWMTDRYANEYERRVFFSGDPMKALNALGNLYIGQQSYAKAIDIFERMADKLSSRGRPAENAPDLLTCRVQIGTLYEKLGNFSKAEETLVLGLAEYNQVASDEVFTFPASFALVDLYVNQKDYAKAESMLKECDDRLQVEHEIRIEKMILKEGRTYQSLTAEVKKNFFWVHRDKYGYLPGQNRTLDAAIHHFDLLKHWATLYLTKGDFPKAKSYFDAARKFGLKFYGEDDTHMIHLSIQLGMLYLKMGDNTNAEKTFLQAVDKSKVLLGENHPDTLYATSRLAYCYEQMENFSAAERLYQECLAKSVTLHGDDDERILEIQNSLSVLYDRQGDYAQAEKILEKTVRDADRIFGENHPLTETYRQNYQAVLEIQKNPNAVKHLPASSKLTPNPLVKPPPSLASHKAQLPPGEPVFVFEYVSNFVYKNILNINGVDSVFWHYQTFEPIDKGEILKLITSQQILMEDPIDGPGYDATEANTPFDRDLTFFQRMFPCCFTIQKKTFVYKYFGRDEGGQLYCSMDRAAAQTFAETFSSSKKIYYRVVQVEEPSNTTLADDEFARVTIDRRSGRVNIDSHGPLDPQEAAANPRIKRSSMTWNELIPSEN